MSDLELYGSPILRSKNSDVDKIDDALLEEIEKMKTLMSKANGIGLAAPQAGINSRFFMTDAPGDELRVFINPQIISASVKEVEIEEGCLSVPGIYGYVTRPEKVVVEFLNIDGESIKLKASGMLARVIQHEFDHLKGILFTDYLDEKVQAKVKKKFERKAKRRKK